MHVIFHPPVRHPYKIQTLALRYHDMTAILSAEPCAVTLAWWYIGSRLSAVCLCQWMWDSRSAVC